LAYDISLEAGVGVLTDDRSLEGSIITFLFSRAWLTPILRNSDYLGTIVAEAKDRADTLRLPRLIRV